MATMLINVSVQKHNTTMYYHTYFTHSGHKLRPKPGLPRAQLSQGKIYKCSNSLLNSLLLLGLQAVLCTTDDIKLACIATHESTST